MAAPFDLVVQALSQGWKMNARNVETGKRYTLAAPLPPGVRTASSWIEASELEPGEYKCTLRAPTARGRNRELERQKLSKLGPLRATVLVGDLVDIGGGVGERGYRSPDSVTVQPEELESDDPQAQAIHAETDRLMAERDRLHAQMELDELKARQDRLAGAGGVDPAVAALTEQVRQLAEQTREQASKRQDDLLHALLKTTMENQASMQAAMFQTFMSGAGKVGAPAGKLDLGPLKDLIEIQDMLRDTATSGGGDSDLGMIVGLLRELRTKGQPQLAEPPPTTLPTAPAPLPAAETPRGPSPAPAPPAPDLQDNGQPQPVSSPVTPDNLGRRRVGAFLEAVQCELVAQTDPHAAADQLVEHPMFTMLPVPLRKVLELGVPADVLAALKEWAPPDAYEVFAGMLEGNDVAMQWLRDFLDALGTEPVPMTVRDAVEAGAGELLADGMVPIPDADG